jgi:hypothetical protein
MSRENKSNSRARILVTAAATLLVPVASAQAADSGLGAPLCDVIKKLLPEVRTYQPEGAQAQRVMAIADKFD